MKIIKVDIPANEAGHGLQDIKMDRLGNIVILAGKNGAGKTRILNKISEKLSVKPTQNDIERYETDIKNRTHSIGQWKQQIKNIEKGVSNNNKERYIHAISQGEIDIEKFKKEKDQKFIITDVEGERYFGISYVPKVQKLADPYKLTKEKIIDGAKLCRDIGTLDLTQRVLPYIQHLQNRYYSATHQHTVFSPEEKQEVIRSYNKLAELIEYNLGTRLIRDPNDTAILFGLPIGEANLSGGQSIVLQYCVALHAQEATLNNSILFMDEPETHMHPSAILEAIDNIRKSNPDGQIWIATHSIPILSHFDTSCLWFVEDGKVSYAGKTPEKVLKSLLGEDDETRARLSNFLNYPDQLALTMHALECLYMPEAVQTGSEDPQTKQIKDYIESITKENGKVKILDYGAGKGRLLANILEQYGDHPDALAKIEYVAYDAFTSDANICKTIIEQAYGNTENKYFNDMHQLNNDIPNNNFDVVVMCNVLHEIDPTQWLELFQPNGVITKLLSDTGVLLLVEDQEMPIGELAHTQGYIVFDTSELKQLFDCESIPYSDARNDGRLKAHIIKRENLEKITAESRIRALRTLQDKSSRKIRELRQSQDKTFMAGKKLGFWLQQYANSGLALKQLETSS